MAKRSLSQLDVSGSRVLVRVDFNVPIEQGIEAIAGYDQRLRATLPTIRHLIDQGCRTILCSHLGRPRGKVDDSLRLAPIGDRLAFLLNHPVKSLPEVTGPEVEAAVSAMSPGDVVLLENLRFDAGEEANDPGFAQSLAALADYFVMDAFAVAHRAHASTVGVTEYLPSAMGFLVEKEVSSMGQALESPEKPLAALMGGAKVSDKILLLENMLGKLDHLFIGGGMCVTFLKAQGHGVGAFAGGGRPARVRPRDAGCRRRAGHQGAPAGRGGGGQRVRAGSRGSAGGSVGPCAGGRHNHGHRAFGSAGSSPATLQECRTVIWNGPMGVFEMPRFSEGTRVVADGHRRRAGHYQRGGRRFHGGDGGGAGANGQHDPRVNWRRGVAGVPGRH